MVTRRSGDAYVLELYAAIPVILEDDLLVDSSHIGKGLGGRAAGSVPAIGVTENNDIIEPYSNVLYGSHQSLRRGPAGAAD